MSNSNKKGGGSPVYGVIVTILTLVFVIMGTFLFLQARQIYLTQSSSSGSPQDVIQTETPDSLPSGTNEEVKDNVTETNIPTPETIQPGLVESVTPNTGVRVNSEKTYSLPQPVGDKIGNSGLLPGTGVAIVQEMTETQVRSDQCTIAFSLSGVDGFPWAITAGHCGKVGQKVYTLPSEGDFRTTTFLGTVRAVSESSYETGDGDWAAIRLDPNALRPSAPAGIPMHLVDTNVERGDRLCKNGSRTGYDCGPQGGKELKTVFNNATAKLDEVILCALSGDSGSPIYSNKGIVGVLSSSTAPASDMKNGYCTQQSGAYYTPVADVISQIRTKVPNAIITDN